MNSPDALPTIQTFSDSTYNPPEKPDWTPADKREAIGRLVDKIMDGEPWDENLEGWKADMFATWENIMLDKHLDKDEQWAQIRDAHFHHVTKHAEEQVRLDPDRYCEAED